MLRRCTDRTRRSQHLLEMRVSRQFLQNGSWNIFSNKMLLFTVVFAYS